MKNDRFFRAVLIIIAIGAVILFAITAYKLVNIGKQVKENTQTIQEQAKPCTTEDSYRPELNPACQ